MNDAFKIEDIPNRKINSPALEVRTGEMKSKICEGIIDCDKNYLSLINAENKSYCGVIRENTHIKIGMIK